MSNPTGAAPAPRLPALLAPPVQATRGAGNPGARNTVGAADGSAGVELARGQRTEREEQRRLVVAHVLRRVCADCLVQLACGSERLRVVELRPDRGDPVQERDVALRELDG